MEEYSFEKFLKILWPWIQLILTYQSFYDTYLTFLDLKKQKLYLKKAVETNNMLVNINEILNDDCLINLFEYLTVDENFFMQKILRKKFSKN